MKKKKIKIIIADDNDQIRQTLNKILAENGYSVKAVKNGNELLARLKKKPPQLIILDLIMPEKGGIEIISTIKSISPETKIIIYTGFQRYQNSIYAIMADRFLLKGTDPKELLQAIKELV